jgi:myo-inositol-1-phosphate synthase
VPGRRGEACAGVAFVNNIPNGEIAEWYTLFGEERRI